MADNELMVTISGAALSLLFYENARSRGDQMGFFLGEVLSFVTKNVTDSERHEESVKVHVDIQSVMKCSPSDRICEPGGKINDDRLNDFIKDKGKNIVGWFRFRRNTSLAPTLKDKILHKQLLSIFRDASNQINENYFVACMLSASTSSPLQGTHKFKHVFLHYKQGVYHPIPLRINNLGHDAARHDGCDYKPTPIKYSDKPDAFTKFVNSLDLDLAHTPGVLSICEIQKAAEQHLESLVPLVVKTDQEVAELERRVMEARQTLFEKLMEKNLRMRETCPIDTKYKPRRQRDKPEKIDEAILSLKKAFFQTEESTSRTSMIQDDICIKPSVTTKQKNRFSMPSGPAMASDDKQVPNPFAKKMYSQAAKKPAERVDDEITPDC